jgi:NADH:ubiquinone reductase (H+-translocating)
LKSIEDATAIRSRLLRAFEEAENAVADGERTAWLTFVIVGGGPTGVPAPGLAPAAKQAGSYAARAIRAALTGQSPPAPFRYRHFGSLATIGREAAVVELGPVHISGALAWWFWGAAHVLFLVGGRNRATVILDWLWAYLTYRRSTRLITGEA